MRVPRLSLIGGLVGWVILLGGAGPAWADDPKMCPICAKAEAEKASYAEKAGWTLARGTTNALLGWTELIAQPANEVKAGGNLVVGIGKGIGQGIKRTLGGAAEVLTFWTPKVQNEYLHFASDCPLCMQRHQAPPSSP